MPASQPRVPTWGVFGGSFNPPHIAHVLAAHFALCTWNLDRLLVIPSYKHPFGKPLEPYDHRIKMCELAFRHLSHFVEISQIERDLGGVSFTVETLRALNQQNPDVELRLIIGGDILADAEKWRAFDEVKQLAPLLVIPRLQQGQVLGASSAAGCYLPDLSSTELRENLYAGRNVDQALPLDVAIYIREQRLYSRKP